MEPHELPEFVDADFVLVAEIDFDEPNNEKEIFCRRKSSSKKRTLRWIKSLLVPALKLSIELSKDYRSMRAKRYT